MSTTSPSNGRTHGRASVPGALQPSAGARARVTAPAGPPAPAAYGTPAGPGRSGTQYKGGGNGGRRGPRWGRIALVGGIAVLVLGLLGAMGAWGYYRFIDSGLDRDDPFSQITAGRPAKVAKGALNILLLGSDSRDPDSKGKAGEWRTDTIIMLHIPASQDKAYLISMPRDLYVHIPKNKANPKLGNTNAKLNASFSWGGTPLTVQTVEEYTKVRMDHVVLIDFAGFKQVIDALGGIDMNIEKTIKSIHKPFREFKQGMNHLDGEAALDYARQRYQFPDADFARMRHQQQMMKAIMDKAASSGTLTNPAKLNAFLKAVTKALTVNKEFSLADMALQFKGIRSENLVFMVSPNLGGKDIKGENVVVPDEPKATALYDAIKNDKMAEWSAANNPSPKPSTSTKPGSSAKPGATKAGG